MGLDLTHKYKKWLTFTYYILYKIVNSIPSIQAMLTEGISFFIQLYV